MSIITSHWCMIMSGQIKDSYKPGGQSLKLPVTVSGLLTDEHQQQFKPDRNYLCTDRFIQFVDLLWSADDLRHGYFFGCLRNCH